MATDAEFVLFVGVVIAIVCIWLGYEYVTDANIRLNGTKTPGTVLRLEEKTTMNQYGQASTTHYLVYEFADDVGQRYTSRRRVTGHYVCKRKGDAVTVYYLPNKPQRNVLA